MSLSVKNTQTYFTGEGPNSQTKLQNQVISQHLRGGGGGRRGRLTIANCFSECMTRRKEGKKPSPLAEYLGKTFKGRRILGKD